MSKPLTHRQGAHEHLKKRFLERHDIDLDTESIQSIEEQCRHQVIHGRTIVPVRISRDGTIPFESRFVVKLGPRYYVVAFDENIDSAITVLP